MLGVGLACVTVFGCYLRQSRTIAIGPDDASPPLQAWDMLHGNPLLHGWWMTGVSFYTTELPQYALIELARGLNTDAVHVAGAMTYTLLVLTAAVLARGRARGAGGATRALIAAGIMLAPQLGPADPGARAVPGPYRDLRPHPAGLPAHRPGLRSPGPGSLVRPRARLARPRLDGPG